MNKYFLYLKFGCVIEKTTETGNMRIQTSREKTYSRIDFCEEKILLTMENALGRSWYLNQMLTQKLVRTCKVKTVI